MDPIGRIASVLTMYCDKALEVFLDIQRAMDTSETTMVARDSIVNKGYAEYVDFERLDLISYEIGRYRRCLDSIEDAKTLARKVFVINFYMSDANFVLNQEASFSYACKMLSLVGPLRDHFASNPSNRQLIQLELKLACQTPLFLLHPCSDLICLETMQRESSPRHKSNYMLPIRFDEANAPQSLECNLECTETLLCELGDDSHLV